MLDEKDFLAQSTDKVSNNCLPCLRNESIRYGTLAMVFFAIIALLSNLLLPFIVFYSKPQISTPSIQLSKLTTASSKFADNGKEVKPPNTASKEDHYFETPQPSQISRIKYSVTFPWLTLSRAWTISHIFSSTIVLSTSLTYPRQPLVDWDLISEPQPGAGNKRIHYARGKTLGGSSALNTMGYHRGTVGTHQRWADLVGDDSYKWENVLPYFKKSTTFTPPNLAKRFPTNATPIYDPTVFDNSLKGPIQVSYSNYIDITSTWLAIAMQSIGLPISPLGFSSGILSGFGAWVTDEIKPEDATRSSSEAGYLRQSIADPQSKITVYTHTQASKILFDSSKNANGVLVNTAGFEYTISAKKEVILCGGVFHSPQLLMLSGTFPFP